MAKVLMVIAHTDFRDEEYEIPRKMLEEAGHQITVASTDLSLAKGKLGMVVQPDILVHDINYHDYDALVFVGGPGATVYFNDTDLLRIIKEAAERQKIIAAICIAPSILAHAGILTDKNATAFPSEASILAQYGAYYTGRFIERDGDILTAHGPDASEEFGKSLVKMLE